LHGRDAEKFGDQGHGVGGELAAASAGAGASDFFELIEPGVGHFAARVGPDGFVDILQRHGVALELAGGDGAAVKDERWNVETCNGHDAAGNGLVAADENNERVEQIAAGDEFDGVGDDFAADQGSAHALGAHGDAVGYGDGVEFQRGAARGADAGFDVGGEFAQVIVARADFDPGVSDADEGFFEVGVLQAARAQHGAGAGTVRAVDKCAAAGHRKRLGHLVRSSRKIGHAELAAFAKARRKSLGPKRAKLQD
jgi:hypothetical protein